MARPKAFDREQALRGALQVFWAKGYEATSMQDLVDGMGIHRQSLYDTFGDKEALYHEALDRYRAESFAPMAALLDGPLPLRRALTTLFDTIIGRLLAPQGQPCFLAQAALERAAEDPHAARCVKQGFDYNLKRWEARFRRAQAEGELGSHHDPAALALAFQNALNGLQVTARSGARRADLDAIARVTLSILG
jgi:TetR/AcrR family transcriptional repressor of nem operon